MGTIRIVRSGILVGMAAAWLVSATAPTVFAAISGTTRVATGLNSPVFATFAPGDKQHLFVVELGGNIKVVDLNSKSVLPTPFLNVPDTKVSGEGGLLGLAFDPNYAKPGTTGFGKFYTYVTVDNGGVSIPGGPSGTTASSAFSTHIRQYSVSAPGALVANSAATEIMSWPRPQNNHVGGWIGVSPIDGNLYIDSGDGGNGNDVGPGHYEPGGNAQNITDSPNDFMGKQLRIDVHGDDFPADATKNYAIPSTNPFVGKTGQDEIWAYGLRNPYRASFDRDTGNMWIGDVGQDQREEVDTQLASSTGVANYGWRLYEGNNNFTAPAGSTPPADYVPPVSDYGHGFGSLQGNAVIGGYVYRGPDPTLQGQYLFADEQSSHFWTMNTSTFAVTNIDSMLTPDIGSLTGSNPSSFGEDAVGNLYVVALGGSVYKINTGPPLPGDYNADGTVDAADYAVWTTSFGSTTSLGADGNHNNIIDAADYTVWRDNLGRSVHTLGSGAGATVPEPAAMQLVFQLLGVCAIMSISRVPVRRRSAFPG
jgi:glucose/arabinose dehydrogenase